MKVLMVIDGTLPHVVNGVSVHAKHLLNELVKICDITVLDISEKATTQTIYTDDCIEIPMIALPITIGDSSLDLPDPAPNGWPRSWIRATYRIIANREWLSDYIKQFDIIHFQDYFCSFLIELCRNNSRAKVITTVHALSHSTNHFSHAMRSYLLSNSDRIISVSEWLTDELLHQWNIPLQKISTIHNGIQMSNHSSQTIRRNNLITYAGRLDEVKGCDILLKSISLLLHSGVVNRNWEVIIMGNGNQREHLENLANSLGIRDMCNFMGIVSPDTVRHYMRQATVHVVPSRMESFGLTAIEGLCEGAIVVASTAGGLPEVLRGSPLAKTFSVDDVFDLTQALQAALCMKVSNTERESEKKRLAFEFSWKQIAQDTFEAYKSTCL